ncbi:MAG: hypothetical protein ABIO39_05420 [Caulobacteraceae bacterium]
MTAVEETQSVAPTPEAPTERIEVSPDQVFQKGPSPKRIWELSFVGHVVSVVALSCIIVFGVIAIVWLALIAFTDLLD